MTNSITTHVLVIGGGPGGYVAAIRAGQLGLDTTLVEADRLGGTCLIRGCIPSKALIHVAGKFEQVAGLANGGAQGIRLPGGEPRFDLGEAVRWKDGVVDRLESGVTGLLQRAGVRVVHGWATFSDGKTCAVATDDGPVTIRAEHVVLANGSRPTQIPSLPFDDFVISSTGVLALDALPAHIAVIGAGYIGLELAVALCKFGARVTVVEAEERPLPGFDEALAAPVRKWLESHGVDLYLGATASGTVADNGKRRLRFEDADGQPHELACDRVLVAVGRQPLTDGWGLEDMGVARGGAFVKVDDQCRTSMRNVWAIGDLAGPPMLAHKASAQGTMVAEIIAGRQHRFEPTAIPAVCYTDPEIVSVGMTRTQAEDAGFETVIGKFPMAANGRALSMQADADGGFVQVVARKDNHVILGIEAVGAHVADLSGEFTLALEMGARLEDLAATIHAHPTLAETLPEAALMALGSPIHF